MADYGLVPRPRGALGNLVPAAVQPSSLQPGQVAVSVRAVGLNFRDVLNVLGMYPGDPGNPGSDFAGVVAAASGSQAASRLPPGTPVFGLAPGCLGTMVHSTPATLVAMPGNCLSFEEAASMPTVCTTVQLAFAAAAGVQAGQRVLMPGAAGGVGLAAVHLLQAKGAQVIATAGQPAK
ncbi:chaperonin 10-like protein, partial [Haematococcus lacustris]